MTEDDWLTYEQPQPMLRHVRERVTARKLRLFAVACCRRIWPMLTDERSRHAVEVAEHVADGQVRRKEQAAAALAARAAGALTNPPAALAAASAVCYASPKSFCWIVAESTANAAATAAAVLGGSWYSEQAAQAALVREICGNPFRRIAFDLSWLTATVSRVAAAIYDQRQFEGLPILSDALEEAGCTDEAILTHCREPGEHVRGCWVLDSILGKE
jgi:hypothetical protein